MANKYSIEFMAQFINDSVSFPTLTYTPAGTTGNIFLNVLPKSDTTEECIGLFEVPVWDDDLTVYDTPDKYKIEEIKLIYRGTKAIIDTWKVAKSLYDILSLKANWASYGNTARTVFKVTPKGIGSMGTDENGFPEHVMRFRIKIIIH